MKLISSMFLLTFLVSCNQETPPMNVESCLLPGETSDDEELRDCVIPERSDYSAIEVNAFLRDFSLEQEDKMRASLNRLKLVLSSQKFKDRILNHKFNGEFAFNNNNGLTNFEVYEVLMRGAETLDPQVDNELDIDITLYYQDNSTIGYTYASSERIWVNNKFFATNSYGSVGANIAHEWAHKLGFGHSFQRTATRKYSVPYAVGSIAKELIDSM